MATDEERAEELLHYLLSHNDGCRGDQIAAIVKEFGNVRQATIAAFARAHVPFEHDTDFNAELEKHRKRLDQDDQGYRGQNASAETRNVRDAVRFLLTIAHQPVPGGVVDIGGESPHEEDGVARRIHQAMRARGLGFNELDRMLGKSEGYSSRLVSEQRTPRADTLRTISEKLNVSVLWLLSAEGPMELPR